MFVASDLISSASVDGSRYPEGGFYIKANFEVYLRTALPEPSKEDPLSGIYQDGVLLVSSLCHYGHPSEDQIKGTIRHLRAFLGLPEKNALDQLDVNEIGVEFLKKQAQRSAVRDQIRAQKAERRAEKQARRAAIKAYKAQREAES